MITLEEAIIMGVNAPRPHQRVISKLNTALGMLYYKQSAILLEPFPEMMLDDDKTSPTPDISLYDNVLENTPVIIEITRTGMVQTDLKKVRALVDSEDYGIREGFVYDYKLNLWHKYQLGAGDINDRPSFCEAINIDLATLL